LGLTATGTSGLAAAILNFSFPLSYSIFSDSTIEFLDLENNELAVGIALLSCIEAEIQVLLVWRCHLDFLTSGFEMEPFNSAFEFSDPENLQIAEIQIHPVLAAAILNLSFPVSKYGLRSLSDGAIEFCNSENMEAVSKMYFLT
jgi:hypothetical protein